MSTDRDVTHIVRSWLEEGVTTLPDRVLDTVLDQLPTTPQRRSWWPAQRAQRMNSAVKFAFVAAAVVAVVAVGAYLVPRQSNIGGPGAATPSLHPSPSLQAARMTVAGSEKGSLLQLTVGLPAGWTNNDWAANNGVDPPNGIAFFVSLVDNTFADPCTQTQTTPQLGSTVEALATALGEIPDLTASNPVQATIAGRAATYVELTIPSSLPCPPDQFYLWQDSANGYEWVLGLNEVIRVWIVEVQGQRVVIAARSWPGTSDGTKGVLQSILDSMVFDSATSQPSASPAAS
jgi:hypothetical protein